MYTASIFGYNTQYTGDVRARVSVGVQCGVVMMFFTIFWNLQNRRLPIWGIQYCSLLLCRIIFTRSWYYGIVPVESNNIYRSCTTQVRQYIILYIHSCRKLATRSYSTLAYLLKIFSSYKSYTTTNTHQPSHYYIVYYYHYNVIHIILYSIYTLPR